VGAGAGPAQELELSGSGSTEIELEGGLGRGRVVLPPSFSVMACAGRQYRGEGDTLGKWWPVEDRVLQCAHFNAGDRLVYARDMMDSLQARDACFLFADLINKLEPQNVNRFVEHRRFEYSDETIPYPSLSSDDTCSPSFSSSI
jgi:hypothetical protein